MASSPERKAVETLHLAYGVGGDDSIRVDHRFGEVRRVEPVDADYRERRFAWVSGRLDERHRGWETPARAADRFQAGLDDVEGDVLVATHGMIMTAWLVARGVVSAGDPAGAYWSRLALPDIVDACGDHAGR